MMMLMTGGKERTVEDARKKEERRSQMPERQHATWGELLQEAVEKPGRMLEAYNKSLLTVALHE
jgi:hypothetical protein